MRELYLLFIVVDVARLRACAGATGPLRLRLRLLLLLLLGFVVFALRKCERNVRRMRETIIMSEMTDESET